MTVSTTGASLCVDFFLKKIFFYSWRDSAIFLVIVLLKHISLRSISIVGSQTDSECQFRAGNIYMMRICTSYCDGKYFSIGGNNS